MTAIATGREPDPDRVEAVLAASGKTLDDLRAAVELLQTRMAMRTHLNSLPKLQADLHKQEADLQEQMITP